VPGDADKAGPIEAATIAGPMEMAATIPAIGPLYGLPTVHSSFTRQDGAQDRVRELLLSECSIPQVH
jgi:hypothetical protein